MISYQLSNETTISFSQLAEIGERIEEEVFLRILHNSKISTWMSTASSKVTMLLTSSADWLQGIPVIWSGFLSSWRSVIYLRSLIRIMSSRANLAQKISSFFLFTTILTSVEEKLLYHNDSLYDKFLVIFSSWVICFMDEVKNHFMYRW